MSLAFTSPQRRSLRAISVSMVLLALVFIASCKKDDDATDTPPGINAPAALDQPGAGGTNQEGDTFTSVIIGSQEWMSENLNVAIYKDGTPIPEVTDPNVWTSLTTGAWCWYNNDSASYAATYGRLYNWYAVAGIYDAASETNPSLRKQLAPSGWHLPTTAEWTTLIDYLGGSAVAGDKMKTTGTIQDGTGLWHTPNGMASNSSGFSATPGGRRWNMGAYNGINYITFWWSTDEQVSNYPGCLSLIYEVATAPISNGQKDNGYSVRCLRN